jgi:hypothetical protein
VLVVEDLDKVRQDKDKDKACVLRLIVGLGSCIIYTSCLLRSINPIDQVTFNKPADLGLDEHLLHLALFELRSSQVGHAAVVVRRNT